MKERKNTMSSEQNAPQIKKGSYMAIGMLIGLLIGLALDNYPVSFVLGLNFGIAMDKHYR
jgi:hypothetical protein